MLGQIRTRPQVALDLVADIYARRVAIAGLGPNDTYAMRLILEASSAAVQVFMEELFPEEGDKEESDGS